MKINDVEQALGISKANIRFYEKQGLLTPERSENRYRNYSDADVDRLKTIIVLRKLGIPVQNIEKILDGELNLQDAMRNNIADLEKQIEQLEGALNLSRQILREEEESLDTNRYWEIIHQREAKGEKFVEIVSEYWSSIGYPLLATHFGLTDGMSFWKKALIILITCILYGGIRQLFTDDPNFWIGFLHWPFVFLLCTIITFLIFWVGKRWPKLGSFLLNLLAIIIIVALGGVLLLLVGGGLVALWNWIF